MPRIKTLTVDELLTKDTMGCTIARYWVTWNTLRASKIDQWNELRRYLYATDTSWTTNSKLPWKNKTTLPKLTQIRDNLHANYMASLFPKRRWLSWEANDKASNEPEKRMAIENYMGYAIDRSEFKQTFSKLVLDYIDYGNAFGTVEWVDDRVEAPDKSQVGYVGPRPVRISPLDIVFNPVSSNFVDSPKIIRTLMTFGDLKGLLLQQTTEENKDHLNQLFNYLRTVRHNSSSTAYDLTEFDDYLQVDGFTSFRDYLNSDYCELLTFFGDLYDSENDKFYKNYKITVVDRHKILFCEPNESYFGNPQIFHIGWRPRQDNLWAMGPLDNLVGLQYRIDHLENLKADLMDLVTFPPLKIKGLIEDFQWGPFERIYVGDEGDVEIMSPDVQALQVNTEISLLEQKMEEMAGAPKEAMGFRTPGEKTAYEVQRIENAYTRIFQNKIQAFEILLEEPLLNAMLEMAHRKMDATTIPVFNDEFSVVTFQSLTAQDITGYGTIKPLAAQHFAEKAERVQTLTTLFNTPLGQNPAVMVHFSGKRIAEMIEDLLDLDGYNIVEPYVAIGEQAEAQSLATAASEQVAMETMTPSGLTPDDIDTTETPQAGVV